MRSLRWLAITALLLAAAPAFATSFTVLGWTKFVNIDLACWPNLVAYQQRIGARPAVQAAMKAEGLI